MAYDIERYLNIRGAGGASLGPDGELSFLMETTGVSQVWTLAEPRGWPTQRTFYDERVTFATWNPEYRELAFGMDEGGDEFDQLFRLEVDAGLVHPLTDTPDAKHYWGGWTHDGERFAFASNRRDVGLFDVYVQDRTGDDPELVFENDGMGWISAAGFAPGDDRLLVHESRSNFDHDVYVLDLASGDLRQVTDDETARYGSVNWAPDGDAVYLVTDRGHADLDEAADTLYLARLDLETLDLSVVESGGDYDVDGVAMDDETGRLVYSRNVEGYTELTAGELAGPTDVETVPAPDIPEGLSGGVSWGPDADTYALTVTASDRNANVYRVDFETGAAERWTDAATAGIPAETFRSPELVHYESFDGLEIPAFFTTPAEVPEGGMPVIVTFHGGPEGQHRPGFNAVTQYLVNNGYGVFEPNVRGSTGYGRAFTRLDDVRNRMDSVRDGKAAAEWLADRPDVDADRIVAKGGSYGGFMTLAVMTEYPDLWAAGVDIVGIANFVTFLENTGEWRRANREEEYGSLEDDREFLESISPIHEADRIDAPLMVVHGANDSRVPLGEAEQIADAVRSHGRPVELLVFEDEGHGLSKRENRIDAYTKMVAFLDEHV